MRRYINPYLRILPVLFLSFGCTDQIEKTSVAQDVVLMVKSSIAETGAASADWQKTIQVLHQPDTFAFQAKMMTPEEASWADLIRKRIPAWAKMLDSLGIPFKSVMPPDTVTILLGNQGGEDAFVVSDASICFGLDRLFDSYGHATERVNSSRMDRLFAHEYTHLMHRVWQKTNPIVIENPLHQALWECLKEGLGNYRSLSSRWVGEQGELTDHAHLTLIRLQPIFTHRISALARANEAEVIQLMDGLSTGPFHEKWGALTVALWFVNEARGDDSNLQKWVEAGPMGILVLAQKYLPEELRSKLPEVIAR